MKKSFIKNQFMTLYRTRRRFISLLVMAFLGVGFYSGLVATGPDLQKSLDHYLDESKVYDLRIISTLGLTNQDIEALQKIKGVEEAYGIQTQDVRMEMDGTESIAKIIEYYADHNIPSLVMGRLPSTKQECVIDRNYLPKEEQENYLGKKIKLQQEKTEEGEEPIFSQNELEIVGIVDSPIYISSQRGNTSFGNGSIGLYLYVTDSFLTMDYYTEVGVVVEGAKELETNDNEYLEKVATVEEQMEAMKEERQKARYEELVGEATKKVEEAQQKWEEKNQEAQQEFQKAEQELKVAKKNLDKSKEQLKNAQKELQEKEKQANSQFSKAEEQIQSGQDQIKQKEQELEKAKAEFGKNQGQINEAIARIEEGIKQAKKAQLALQKQKEEMQQNGLDTSKIDQAIEQSNKLIASLEQEQNTMQTQLDQAKEKIQAGSNALEQAKMQIQNQIQQLKKTKEQTASQFRVARASISENQKKWEEGSKELESSRQEYETEKAKAEAELSDAKAEIEEARQEITKIENAKWYIQDRLGNTGYANILDAIKTINNIATIFPILFYLVAVLISLTSMTRMIEEERIEIGTLKALGYTNVQIVSKYLLYAFLACIIGGGLGMTLGFYLLPNMIWSLYSILYTMPIFICLYQWNVGVSGIVLSFICIGGATLLVAYRELKQMPSLLMRPKAPKQGKKILLERMTWIWKRFNFSQKVTTRNIFRYKKRAIMTVVGIAGCTALMLTGFGIRDSVIDIPRVQFGEIFQYDASISLLNTKGLDALETYMEQNQEIQNHVNICSTTGTISNGEKDYNITVFVPEESEELSQMISLVDPDTKQPIMLGEDGVIITDKIAQMLGVSLQDEITFVDSDHISYHCKVIGIVKNYVGHYIYMPKNIYEQNGARYETNMLLLEMTDGSEQAVQKMAEEILKQEGVAGISITSQLIETVKDSLKTINYVVIILIVASTLLDFVVLYNLASINIAERQREIATLKVLGFYDKEVDHYINKENMVFTVIGISIGLIFGIGLTAAIITSIEIDSLKFMQNIAWQSYVYAAMITLSFSFIVNRIVHSILKKINMIESLKSVE